MATMNVSIPDQMRDWVEKAVETGQFANTSDYIRVLIRRDKERDQAFETMQQLITEGLESGISERTVDEIWNDAIASHNNA